MPKKSKKELTAKERQQLEELANKYKVSLKDLEHDYWVRTRIVGAEKELVLKDIENDLSGGTKQTPLTF